jgi:hypothetical protein
MKTSEIKVNVNFKILPFGHVLIEMKGNEGIKESILEKPLVIYGEPGITNQKASEIRFGGEEYKAPKTTGGIL